MELLYHVTYLNLLDSILDQGLRPGGSQTFGGGYGFHATGRVFLTDGDGVSFWASKYEDQANALTDRPEEGWVPVVIEVDAEGLKLQKDDFGSKDACSDSFFVGQRIDPERLVSVFDGEDWVELDDVDTGKMLERALEAADVEEEDGELLYWMDFDVLIPNDW